MVTLGTGIGGGFILNGRLYSGSGMAGEIGHMVIEAGGFPVAVAAVGAGGVQLGSGTNSDGIRRYGETSGQHPA